MKNGRKIKTIVFIVLIALSLAGAVAILVKFPAELAIMYTISDELIYLKTITAVALVFGLSLISGLAYVFSHKKGYAQFIINLVSLAIYAYFFVLNI